MDKLDTLKTRRMLINNEIQDIETAKRNKENAALIGKCYKYRNCYSCPQGEQDYWWLYSKIIDTADGGLNSFRFQTDNIGKINIEPSYYTLASDRQEEITSVEFDEAWQTLMVSLNEQFTSMEPNEGES